MKLDKEQVELINSFLVKNEVVFDDVRYEIIDHIACDVEENYAEIPFPDAVKIVFKKWEFQIRMSHSIWISSWSNFPKITVEKLKQLSIPQAVVTSLIIILSLIINIYFPNIIEHFLVYEHTFKLIYGLWFIGISVLGLKLFFTKAYTTYKYIFKRNFYMIYLITIILFIGYVNGSTSFTYLFVNLSFTIFFIQNYRAHFKFIKNNLI